MGEKLRADPEWISGLGNYVLALNGNLQKTVQLVSGHAGSTGEFKGLMSGLKGPVDTLRDATVKRQGTLDPALVGTGVNLKQAAWNYTSTDHNAALGIAHTRTDAHNPNPFPSPLEFYLPKPVVDDFPGARTLTAPRSVDVAAPPPEDVDWDGIIQETAGWLGDADRAIENLTGWSPIQEALEPVAGNWMELKRIGRTYGKSGTAFDTIAGDLTSGHNEVDSHWNGKAAIAFTNYNIAMVRGLNWEGSVGRLLDRGLSMAADKLQEAAKAIIELVKKGLSRLIKVDSFEGILKLAAKVVPGAGQLPPSQR